MTFLNMYISLKKMKSFKSMLRVVIILSVAATTTAQAHTGIESSGFIHGLSHPFGMDHLLAMVAVGFWSASKLPRSHIWFGPAIFMSMLLVGACLGSIGLTFPYVESLIAISVIAFGALIVLSRLSIPSWVGLLLLGSGSLFHGYAHGIESTGSSFLAYSLGFLLTTATLHVIGALSSLTLVNRKPKFVRLANSLFGIFLSGTGFYFLGGFKYEVQHGLKTGETLGTEF